MEKPSKIEPSSFTAAGHLTGNRVITVSCWTQLTISFSCWFPAPARLHPNHRSNETKTMMIMAMMMERPTDHKRDACLSA